MDIAQNALNTFEKMKIVKFERIYEKKKVGGKIRLVPSVLVSLNPPYNVSIEFSLGNVLTFHFQDEKSLFQVIDQIGALCLPSPSTKSVIRQHINSPTSSRL
jgi:hypothetical protein